MNEKRHPDDGTEPTYDEDAMARILEHTGPRPRPPEALREEMRELARAAWRRQVETSGSGRTTMPPTAIRPAAERPTARPRRPARSRRRDEISWRRALPLAAGVLLAVALGFFALDGFGPSEESPDGGPAPAAIVATIEARFGFGLDEAPGPGSALRAGDSIATGPGERIALRLADGETSARLDAETRVRFVAPMVLAVEQGGVYFDTGSSDTGSSSTGDAGPRLEVRTPFATAYDIGTRFETRVGAETLVVRVRDGAVDVVPAREIRHRADAGTALTVGAAGEIERATIASDAEAWDWAMRAAPPFDIDGRTLHEVLAWVGRETGWQVRYADAEVEVMARSSVTRGDLDGLTPAEAPELVVPVSGLSHRLDGRVLVIER